MIVVIPIDNEKSKTSKCLKIAPILTILFLGLFSCLALDLYSQSTGFKYFKNYSYKEYDHTPQNWGIARAKNGTIYAANNGGVLEFDGVSWRVIATPHYDIVRSLAIDKKGTIYIGGINNIWYLVPDSTGSLKYKSLLNHLRDDQKNFGYVWSTHAAKQGIFYRTSNFLFLWDPNLKKITSWTSPHKFWNTFVYNGDFFVNEKNRGLLKMVDGSLKLLPGTELFKDNKIYFLAPYDKNKTRELIIGTQTIGFFIYDGKAVKPFSTGADDYLKKNKLYHGIRLSSGDFALATLYGGLLVIDPQGHLKDILDKNSGLQDDNVKYVFQDIHENLWLCLDNGISKIEYASPFSIYDQRCKLEGLVLSVLKHDNVLYAGTSKGLYYLESGKNFQPVPGMSGECMDLVPVGDSILAASSEGGFQVKKNIKRNVIKSLAFALLISKRYPGRIWCGTNDGLAALSQKNGNWRNEYRFEHIRQSIHSIAEDKQGNLWLGTLTGYVFKVEEPNNPARSVVTKYDKSHGLPGRETYVAEAAGHIVFATEKGLYCFDRKTKSFIPDLVLGHQFAGGARPVFRIAEAKNKHIWFHSKSRNYQAIPLPGNTYKIIYRPFLRIPPTVQVNAIYPDPDGKTTWFASNDGLFSYDTTVKKNYTQRFHTLIRKVLVNEKQKNEKKLLDGPINKNKTDKAAKGFFPIIEYRDRNLYFEFAAPFFEAETRTQYRCFLEGYDSDWSTWNKETRKYYTNLDSGLYNFRVQAKNIYGNEGKEDAFRFKILPPWYNTWWSFVIYTCLLLGLMFLVVKWRSGRLEQEKQRLEQLVEERTKEVYHKNELLEEQSQKLKEMDRMKSRFFANISHEFRTPLTLILSPLEKMISNSQDRQQKKELNVMRRNSQRLLTLINQLLDLTRFDSGKMTLQAAYQNIVPFLKGILASFHTLAQQNQLELEFHPQEDNISLYFDAHKMEEVMYNLLINAIKFTSPQGTITVSVLKEKPGPAKESRGLHDYIKISVRDTGIGIPQEQIIHIFDRFYQAENSKDKNQIGTGIGLALTREIVQLHHGIIDVHSREGKGTEFEIRLPLGKEHLKANEIVTASEIPPLYQKENELKTLYMTQEEKEDEGAETEHDTIHEDKTPGQEKNVILVVEDHADVRKYIRDPLEPDYTVVEAGDGKEGIKKAIELIPDLIVSDIMMPEADGFELTRVLKKDVRTSHIPIILLTAKASEKSIVRGLETGADDYVTKPFNSKILLTRIKNLIDLRRQLQLRIQRQKMLLPAEISVSSVDDTFLKEFQDIIEKNLSDPELNIDMLCKKLYMGRSTLYRKVQALTGEPPHQFILSYRLERAAQLLKNNYGNVTEVAMATGFSNPQHFSQCFKEKFHQPPSSFKTHGMGDL
jgi:signal transduction histidine kinase/DNA-binding response OmpR family regulator